MATKNKNVFISYSSANLKEAEKIRDYLESNGLLCWMAPRDIKPGDNYARAIIDAINSTSVFVLLLTPESNESVQVHREVDRAINLKHFIIPYMLAPTRPGPEMEYYLCNTQWIDPKLEGEVLAKTKMLNQAKDFLKNGQKVFESKVQISKKKSNWVWGLSACLALLLVATGVVSTNPQFKKKLAKFVDLGKPMSDRFINEELVAKTDAELLYMQAEILARRGFAFNSPAAKKYFSEYRWYNPPVLTNMEERKKHNIKIIVEKLTDTEHENFNILEMMKRDKKNELIANGRYPSPMPKEAAILTFEMNESNRINEIIPDSHFMSSQIQGWLIKEEMLRAYHFPRLELDKNSDLKNEFFNSQKPTFVYRINDTELNIDSQNQVKIGYYGKIGQATANFMKKELQKIAKTKWEVEILEAEKDLFWGKNGIEITFSLPESLVKMEPVKLSEKVDSIMESALGAATHAWPLALNSDQFDNQVELDRTPAAQAASGPALSDDDVMFEEQARWDDQLFELDSELDDYEI